MLNKRQRNQSNQPQKQSQSYKQYSLVQSQQLLPNKQKPKKLSQQAFPKNVHQIIFKKYTLKNQKNQEIDQEQFKSIAKSNKCVFCICLLLSVGILVLAGFGSLHILQKYNQLTIQKIPQIPLQRSTFQHICSNNHQKIKLKDKFRIRQHFRPHTPIPKSFKADMYQFKKSAYEMIRQNKQYFPEFQTRPEIRRSIKMLQLVHNIDINGQFVFDNFDNYKCPEQKYLQLSKILQQQKSYYNQKYEIQKYRSDQIRFCVFVPSYNNAQRLRLYLRNLDSIFQQDYKNYHLVYVDDSSPDGTGQYVQNYMIDNNIPSDKYRLIKNQKRMGSGYNFYKGATQYCNQGQVFIIIDGDDSLIGRQVFAVLNSIYQKQKVAITYGQYFYLWPAYIQQGSGQPLPTQVLQKGNYRSLGRYYLGHLKTFYVDLFRQINVQDLKYPNGTFMDHATDQVIMTPMIQLAGTRTRFIRQFFYQYRAQHGGNQDWDGQKVVQKQVYQGKPYNKSSNLTFADNSKTTHYQ